MTPEENLPFRHILNVPEGPLPTIDYSAPFPNIQGALGEMLVRQVSSPRQQMLCSAILHTWQSAIAGNHEARQGAAANIPDWFEINETNGTIVEFVEVKAVTGKNCDDRKRETWIRTWEDVFPETALISPGWAARLRENWPDQVTKICRQMRSQILRAFELQDAGILQLNPNLRMRLYIPQGETFSSDFPYELSVIYEGQQYSVPLIVSYLPQLAALNDHIRQYKPLPDQPPANHSATPTEELHTRKETMRMYYDRLIAAFGSADTAEDVLKILLTGSRLTDAEDILNAAQSVNPTLLHHVVFEMSGRKRAGVSKLTQKEFQLSLSNAHIGLDKDTQEILLGALTKILSKILSSPTLPDYPHILQAKNVHTYT